MDMSTEANKASDMVMIEKLAERIGDLEKDCIKCRTEQTSDIEHLKEEQKEMKRDVLYIKQNIEDLKQQVQSLTLKLSISVAIVVTVINLIAPIVLKKMGN